MFDFEKLEVYKKAKSFNKGIYTYLTSTKNLDGVEISQSRPPSFRFSEPLKIKSHFPCYPYSMLAGGLLL